MNFRKHFFINLTILLILWFLLTDITFSMIFIALFWGVLIPDADHKFKRHRYFLFHSITFPLLAFIFEPSTLLALMIFSQSLHLLCDIRFNRSKMIGFYTIKITKHRGLNGINSTIFLISNFIIGLTILTVWVWFYV